MWAYGAPGPKLWSGRAGILTPAHLMPGPLNILSALCSSVSHGQLGRVVERTVARLGCPWPRGSIFAAFPWLGAALSTWSAGRMLRWSWGYTWGGPSHRAALAWWAFPECSVSCCHLPPLFLWTASWALTPQASCHMHPVIFIALPRWAEGSYYPDFTDAETEAGPGSLTSGGLGWSAGATLGAELCTQAPHGCWECPPTTGMSIGPVVFVSAATYVAWRPNSSLLGIISGSLWLGESRQWPHYQIRRKARGVNKWNVYSSGMSRIIYWVGQASSPRFSLEGSISWTQHVAQVGEHRDREDGWVSVPSHLRSCDLELVCRGLSRCWILKMTFIPPHL